MQKLGKNYTTAEKVVCESLEKGIEYTIDAMMEQTAEEIEKIRKGYKNNGKRRKN